MLSFELTLECSLKSGRYEYVYTEANVRLCTVRMYVNACNNSHTTFACVCMSECLITSAFHSSTLSVETTICVYCQHPRRHYHRHPTLVNILHWTPPTPPRMLVLLTCVRRKINNRSGVTYSFYQCCKCSLNMDFQPALAI